MKKHVFLFILILVFLSGLTACAEGEIFSFSFETETQALFWSGGFYDESNPFESGYSIFVNNPFGEVKNDKVTHVLDYSEKIHLEAGKVYTLRGYVLNPLSGYSPTVRTQASLLSGATTVIVNVSGIGDEWAPFSTTFYAGETGTYNLAIHFGEGASDFGFFVDEISLSETPCTLSSLQLLGQSEILIPATGSVKAYYRPLLITSDGAQVHLLVDNSVYISATQHEGVTFNPSDFSLTVDSGAVTGTSVTISCALRNFPNLAPTSYVVELTDNMIDNPGFEEENADWSTTAKLETHSENENTFISLPTNDYGDFGYFATLSYETPQVLLEGVLYVMHARIKSDYEAPFSAIYAKNTTQLVDSTVYFNIKDISGEEWLDVFAAFVPEVSGVYNIALNLCSTYDCTIFVDDIRLCSEVIKPEYVTLHAPGNIALPDVETSYEVSALVRDQLGNILDTQNAYITLENGNSSVYFDSRTNLLTVSPDAAPGEYKLVAHYVDNPAIRAELTVTVSFDYVGDGTFEKTVPNEWWMVSSPYDTKFYIRYDGYSKRALINCDGSYFMLLNNSYVHLMENSAYVFNSNFSASTDCTVTLFIETVQGEILPLAQFFVPSGSTLDDKLPPELFLAEEDCVGRLFLYIESNSGEGFSVYTDNLSLKKAAILAGNLHISGSPYVNGAAEAKFSFLNTVAGNDDTSACVVNWYYADSVSGPYTMIDTGGRNIYFDTSFFNKYVYFEVIPICPITGFSGDSVRSMPFLVTYEWIENPFENSTQNPITIPDFKISQSNSYFSDIDSHWGKDYINTLAHNNVVSGKSTRLFCPEDGVTRAEFAKMLSSAFSINPYADFTVFDDVNKKDWFYKYVSALNLAGICEGTSPTAFSPHSYVTREAAAVMLIRIYEKVGGPAPAITAHEFTDSKSISPWAKDAADKAASLGIVQGDTLGALNPQAITTRAEAAALIMRLVNSLILEEV